MAKGIIPDRVVPMRVIVCGLQRTGTLSVRHALYRLGIHDCYHMHDVRNNPDEDGAFWIRAFKAKYAADGSFEKEDWDKLLGQCQAVCDIPAAFFGAELAEIYPDAKVIILSREPESWYNSVSNSIHADKPLKTKIRMMFCMVFNPTVRSWVRFGMTMSGLGMGFNHRTEKDKALAWYQAMYDEFRERIPSERRIEYKVGDGWAPLCQHLGVPVPMVEDPETGKTVEAPFPHYNDRESFVKESAHIQERWVAKSFDNIFNFIGRAAVTGGVAYTGYVLWKTRLGGRF